jgi:hypothetical protein
MSPQAVSRQIAISQFLHTFGCSCRQLLVPQAVNVP